MKLANLRVYEVWCGYKIMENSKVASHKKQEDVHVALINNISKEQQFLA